MRISYADEAGEAVAAMAIEHGGALAGRTLGGYQIVSLLGVGGMAEVYRARDEALEREVAVKVLPRTLAGDPEYVQRFRDEGRRVAALDHPHVVPVYQFGEEDGLLFLVMPLLRESLRERMARDGILQPEVAAGIALEIAQALDAAHGLGLVHRDVKPENVLLDAEGKALLTDFGIARPEARLREAGAARTLASTGLPVGTPEYMAPEQLKAEAVDHRVDVYGLGAVYYELVTGAVPYPGATPYEVAANVLTTPLAPPSSHNVNLWPELDAVTMTALAKNPDERYADVRGFAATLHRAILQHDSSVSGLFLPDGWAEAAAVTQRIPVVALTAADADASERAEFTTGAADFAAARSEAWRERFRLQPALSRKAMVAIAAVVVLLIGLCGGSGLAVLGQFSGSAPGASFLSSLGGGPTDTAGANIPSATHTTGSGSVSSSHATAGAGAPPLSGGGGGPVPPVGPGTPQPTVGPGTPAPTPAPGSTATPTPLPTSTVAPPPGPTPTSTPSISPLVLNPPNGGIVQLNRSNGYCTGQQAITNGNTSPVNWSWNSSSPNIGWIFYRFGNSWFAGMPQTTTAARTTDTLNIAMSCSSGQAYLITMSDGVYSYTFTLHAP